MELERFSSSTETQEGKIMKQTLKSFGFLMVLLAVLVAGVARAEEEPYVILVSLDGFRWDYTQRGITPTFDKISQEGVSALSLQPVFPSKTFPACTQKTTAF